MNNRSLVCYSLTDLTKSIVRISEKSATKPPIRRIADLLPCCRIDQQKHIHLILVYLN